MNVNMNLKGIGLSFVDGDPKEVLYISLYKITTRAFLETHLNTKNQLSSTTYTVVDFKLYHFQIDN